MRKFCFWCGDDLSEDTLHLRPHGEGESKLCCRRCLDLDVSAGGVVGRYRVLLRRPCVGTEADLLLPQGDSLE